MVQPWTCYFYRDGYCAHKHDTGCGFYGEDNKCFLSIQENRKTDSADAFDDDDLGYFELPEDDLGYYEPPEGVHWCPWYDEGCCIHPLYSKICYYSDDGVCTKYTNEGFDTDFWGDEEKDNWF